MAGPAGASVRSHCAAQALTSRTAVSASETTPAFTPYALASCAAKSDLLQTAVLRHSSYRTHSLVRAGLVCSKHVKVCARSSVQTFHFPASRRSLQCRKSGRQLVCRFEPRGSQGSADCSGIYTLCLLPHTAVPAPCAGLPGTVRCHRAAEHLHGAPGMFLPDVHSSACRAISNCGADFGTEECLSLPYGSATAADYPALPPAGVQNCLQIGVGTATAHKCVAHPACIDADDARTRSTQRRPDATKHGRR